MPRITDVPFASRVPLRPFFSPWLGSLVFVLMIRLGEHLSFFFFFSQVVSAFVTWHCPVGPRYGSIWCSVSQRDWVAIPRDVCWAASRPLPPPLEVLLVRGGVCGWGLGVGFGLWVVVCFSEVVVLFEEGEWLGHLPPFPFLFRL